MVYELKNKKIFIILIISILLLCALIGLCIYLFTLPKADAWKEPIDTEVLLPDPATVNFYYGDQQYPLTEAAQAMVYETMSDWLATVKSCSHAQVERPHQPAEVRFEFCYNGPYQYVGSIGTEEPLSSEPFVYSKISVGWIISSLQILPSSVYITPYKDGQYYGIDRTRTYLSLDVEPNDLDTLIVAALLGTPSANVSEDVVESSIFPAKPDSIVVYRAGQKKELSSTQLDNVYHEFTQAKSSWLGHAQTTSIQGYGAFRALESVCVEFRYHKRQKYMPDEIPPNDGPLSGSLISFEAFYGNQEYDALLFVIEENTDNFSFSNKMEIGVYAQGQYHCASMHVYSSNVKKEFTEYIITFLE